MHSHTERDQHRESLRAYNVYSKLGTLLGIVAAIGNFLNGRMKVINRRNYRFIMETLTDP